MDSDLSRPATQLPQPSELPAGNSKPHKMPPLQEGEHARAVQGSPLSHDAITGAKIVRRPIPRRATNGRGSKTIYVSTNASFQSVVRRVRKCLEAGPNGAKNHNSSTKGLPLAARIAALQVQGSAAQREAADGERAEHEVLFIGTGRAIEKTLNIAVWFSKQRDYRVSVRTRTVAVVDDVVLDDDDDGEADSRVRRMSALEVGVRLR